MIRARECPSLMSFSLVYALLAILFNKSDEHFRQHLGFTFVLDIFVLNILGEAVEMKSHWLGGHGLEAQN